MFRSMLLWLAVLVCLCQCSPRQRQNPVSNSRVVPASSGNDLLVDAQIGHLLRNAPKGATLLRAYPDIPALKDRLISNATEIRENLIDSFTCDDKGYGYYADKDNECQVFHVCLPFKEIYPDSFTEDVTFTFSFICPKYTVFSQDSLTCAWEVEALPCEEADKLYDINKNFFKIIRKEGNKTIYAELG
ncbi:U-scoloptoxin(01)-Cw1a-like [Panulirus ornatus]|uniref:U-scoloptoxin(01)-Cw1a-like n=1 Tax=Panulirus ornatus TaxID=150431 RepID=UPI003A8BB030